MILITLHGDDNHPANVIFFTNTRLLLPLSLDCS